MSKDMEILQGMLENLNLDIRQQKYNPSCIARCYCCKAPHDLINRPLKRCGGCQLVSYCNKDCQMQDRPEHKEFCKEFRMVNGKNALFSIGPWEDRIKCLRIRAAALSYGDETKAIFLHPRVCNVCHESRHNSLIDCKCAHVAYCSPTCADADLSHKADCSKLAKEELDFSYHMIQKAFSMSLKFSLAFMSKCEIGLEKLWLFDVSTLIIHVVSSNPMLDSYYWEVAFLHMPDLMHLEIVFVIPDKKFDISNPSNKLNWPLCTSCKDKNRTVTYSTQQMQYHDYFASLEYTEPDVVAVYGNSREMSSADDGYHIHCELSYRNMIHSEHTILVLMDVSEHLVKLGARTVELCHSSEEDDNVYEVMKPWINEDRGFTDNGINDKYYFTCLKKILVF